MVRRDVRLEQCHARRGARRRHLLGVGRRGSERFLAEHVLARGGGALHPGPVEAVRERNVDRLDVGVVEQPGVRSIGSLGAEPLAGVGLALTRDRDEPCGVAGSDHGEGCPASDARLGMRHRRPEHRFAHQWPLRHQ